MISHKSLFDGVHSTIEEERVTFCICTGIELTNNHEVFADASLFIH